MEYNFNIGDKVLFKNIECIIVDREYYDNEPDYLCKPVNETEKIQNELGSAWVREENLKLL